jgi:glycosyltransferase involved in cell wall biosynthesis
MPTAESPIKKSALCSNQQIAVVIPVYNQSGRLREVISRCLAICPRVLVVDDGSDDEAAQYLADLFVEVIRHHVNKGKGAAIRTAANYLRGHGVTHMITIDADGQHYPEDLPRFIEAIYEHPEALIIGVRDFGNDTVPVSSRFGRAFGNFWVRIQTGTKVHDIQSGFRAYPLVMFEHLSCWSQRYAFEVEVVVRALWGGVKVHEVDVQVHYPKPEQRNSHFHKFRDNARVSILNTHLTMRAFLPWPHRLLIGAEAAVPITIWRPLRSIKIMLTERATPKELVFAVALGVFLGAVPLIACHTLVILMAAALLRLNRVVAIAASQICMPPVVPAICIEVGHFMRYGSFITLSGINNLHGASFLDLGYMGLLCIWDWLLGSLVVGTILAIVFGSLTYITARVLQRK